MGSPITHILHVYVFFFNDTATTEIYTLSLHDALPISGGPARRPGLHAEPHRTGDDRPRRRPPSTGQQHRRRPARRPHRPARDRKSTRLNSSHANISYAVFCLKKKKRIQNSLVTASVAE